MRATARVVESAAVCVPAVIGCLKPVVLLPARLFSGLSDEQIEALIAHELAHVVRHDYLVNIAQSIVEALLFYHPAVWWVSRGSAWSASTAATTWRSPRRGTASPMPMRSPRSKPGAARNPNWGSRPSEVPSCHASNDSSGWSPSARAARCGRRTPWRGCSSPVPSALPPSRSPRSPIPRPATASARVTARRTRRTAPSTSSMTSR
ncbi:MAG: M56 family metallopeptidase [Planctomycetes bacterium]|nr:M56 family metallopeptidase [Planctomycetota bacterium]